MSEVLSKINLGLIILIIAVLIIVLAIALGAGSNIGEGDVNLVVQTGSGSKASIDTKNNSLLIIPTSSTKGLFNVTFLSNKSEDKLDESGRTIYISNQAAIGSGTIANVGGENITVNGMKEPISGSKVCPNELGIFVSLGKDVFSRINPTCYDSSLPDPCSKCLGVI